MVVFMYIVLLLIILVLYKNNESFDNLKSDYPCRVFLSDNDFLKHMITHHQMAVDVSIQHIKHTKSDIMMKMLRELIWTQKYEIVMMMEELNNKTENISKITNNKPFIPTISSSIYPNVVGLTNAYCYPDFFSSNMNKHRNPHNMIKTDTQYIHHMIPHHQVAIDMCKILLKHTKSDFLIYLAYRMIRGQESEIILLNDMLKSPLTNYFINTKMF
jgi:uncharacterized protein (DUF305 family)